MDLSNESCLASWQACVGKYFSTGHCMQTFEEILFIPALLVGTIDFYHFIPLSMSLRRSAQSKTSWHHFLANFSTDQDEI